MSVMNVKRLRSDENMELSYKIIGNGNGNIYLCYYPVYEKLIKETTKNKEYESINNKNIIWPCKLTLYKEQFSNQDTPENAVIGLIIKVDDDANVMCMLETILNTYGRVCSNGWYLTNPDEVYSIVDNMNSIFKKCNIYNNF